MAKALTKTVTSQDLHRRTVRAFAIWGVALLLGAVLFLAVKTASVADGVPWPLRKVLNFNATIGERLARPERVDLAKLGAPLRKNARVNGDVGLNAPIDLASWRLQVTSQGKQRTEDAGALLTITDLLAMPKTEVTIQFKCIEGWSEVMSFGGVRFSDFLRARHLGTKSGAEVDWEHHADDIYHYVGMETPDGEYYVSLDMRSLMNPNTLLAYEQNGAPLTLEHGAPLRLYVPNKYGVKSLKRIGRITFTDQRPADYWQEEGYDWFNGL